MFVARLIGISVYRDSVNREWSKVNNEQADFVYEMSLKPGERVARRSGFSCRSGVGVMSRIRVVSHTRVVSCHIIVAECCHAGIVSFRSVTWYRQDGIQS